MEISIAAEARAVEAAINEAVDASTIAGAGHGPLDVASPSKSLRLFVKGDVKSTLCVWR